MAKTFLEIFEKYKANESCTDILNKASNIKLQANTENRIIQISVDFPMLVNKDDLYYIENEIAKAYSLSLVKIMPHYPADFFTDRYIPELIKETERVGIVAKGFFSKYRYNLEGDTLTVEIPFSEDGVGLVCDARTPEVMQRIVLSEFGLRIKVNIVHTTDELFLASNNSLEKYIEDFDKRMAAEAKAYEARMAARMTSAPPTEEEANMLPRKTSIFNENAVPEIENGICRIGSGVFDISSPDYVYGEPFEIVPTSIAEITKPMRSIVVIATVAEANGNEYKDGAHLHFEITKDGTVVDPATYLTLEEK